MREVVIIGVGMHKCGRFPGKTYAEMAGEAITAALHDSGVAWKEVQAAYCAHSYAGTGAGSRVVDQLGKTGIPVYTIEEGCSGGASANGMAFQSIATGLYDVVCAVGFEKMPKGILPADEFPEWTRVTGLAAYPILEAWLAHEYMTKWGITREHLAKVSIKSHNNAALNPYAHYQDNANMSIEDVLNSRMIAEPLTVMQIAPVSEGASAAILCAKEVAHRYTGKPVTVASFSLKSGSYAHPSSVLDMVPTSTISGRQSVKEAYERAGCGPEDLDIMGCHDAYTITEIEDYVVNGLCKEEDIGHMIDEGAFEIGGKIPVNTDGGMMSRGNVIGACSLASIIEIVWQMRGQAGKRQLDKCRVGLVTSVGIGPIITATILKK